MDENIVKLERERSKINVMIAMGALEYVKKDDSTSFALFLRGNCYL